MTLASTSLRALSRLNVKVIVKRSLPKLLARDSSPSLPTRTQPLPAAGVCVCGLDHYNITASPSLIERVKHFYTDIIGLQVGPRAHLDHQGYWLYAGTMPILHLSARANAPVTYSAPQSFFNHISLRCVGLSAAIAKLQATLTPYRIVKLADLKQTQIFLTDPAGLSVELTFVDEAV